MAWLNEPEVVQSELAAQFLSAIPSREGLLPVPGAYDALTGLLAREAGFSVLYLSGAAYTASRGLPDLGMITVTEMAERARDIVRATRLPLIVDIDTGYGGVLDVARTAREMTEAKVAAVQMEDQELPKKCGHLNGKRIIPTEEMVQKIRMLKTVSPTLALVARTDARAVEGLDAAIERCQRYWDAGADVIFPEALEGGAEFRQVAQAVDAPLLANMTEFGRTPYYTQQQFQAFGFKLVIYPVSALRVAAKAAAELFQTLKSEGTQQSKLDAMQTRQELYDVIGYFDYEVLDQRIARTVVPEPPLSHDEMSDDITPSGGPIK